MGRGVQRWGGKAGGRRGAGRGGNVNTKPGGKGIIPKAQETIPAHGVKRKQGQQGWGGGEKQGKGGQRRGPQKWAGTGQAKARKEKQQAWGSRGERTGANTIAVGWKPPGHDDTLEELAEAAAKVPDDSPVQGPAGRGVGSTTPAWMMQSQNLKDAQPSLQGTSDQTVLGEPRGPAGRGRGSTLPAWQTSSEPPSIPRETLAVDKATPVPDNADRDNLAAATPEFDPLAEFNSEAAKSSNGWQADWRGKSWASGNRGPGRNKWDTEDVGSSKNWGANGNSGGGWHGAGAGSTWRNAGTSWPSQWRQGGTAAGWKRDDRGDASEMAWTKGLKDESSTSKAGGWHESLQDTASSKVSSATACFLVPCAAHGISRNWDAVMLCNKQWICRLDNQCVVYIGGSHCPSRAECPAPGDIGPYPMLTDEHTSAADEFAPDQRRALRRPQSKLLNVAIASVERQEMQEKQRETSEKEAVDAFLKPIAWNDL